MANLLKINLNDHIIFTPTEQTATIWNKYWGDLKVFNQPIAMKTLENGKIEMAFHEFMRIFGPHIGYIESEMPLNNMNVEVRRMC